MSEVWQSTLNWQPNDLQQQQFQQLYQLILEGNRSLNLTRITAPEEFWEKHLWDSLRPLQRWLEQASADSCKVIDIGTGAGFPGVPVAIAFPHFHLTLLDSTRKKIAFLQTVLETLNLSTTKTLTDRVEAVGHQGSQRESYDLALLRAVAPAAVCAEYALPLLKVGGLAILYRGQWTDEETDVLAAVVQQLGGKIEAVDGFHTPLSQSVRHCLHLRKVAATPAQFPRPTGIPTQKPLA